VGSGAYAVVDVSKKRSTDLQDIAKAPAAVAAFGGKFIIRTENVTGFDGTPPKRLIVLGFDSVDKTEAWDASAAQQEIDGFASSRRSHVPSLSKGCERKQALCRPSDAVRTYDKSRLITSRISLTNRRGFRHCEIVGIASVYCSAHLLAPRLLRSFKKRRRAIEWQLNRCCCAMSDSGFRISAPQAAKHENPIAD
jgi:uncharacterized protein (DUF1330 family)